MSFAFEDSPHKPDTRMQWWLIRGFLLTLRFSLSCKLVYEYGLLSFVFFVISLFTYIPTL